MKTKMKLMIVLAFAAGVSALSSCGSAPGPSNVGIPSLGPPAGQLIGEK